MRYRATLAYVGTFFHGWQLQENAPRTVQGTVEEVLSEIFGSRTRVHASGRTDAGVHADGQVVHFDAAEMEPGGLRERANRHLPWDVKFLDVHAAAPEFHARSDARRKLYLYRFSRERVIPPHDALFVAPLSARADAARMARAARLLCGTRDFFPFSTSGTETETTIRNLEACEVVEEGARITLELTADGFLRGMARAIAGTLADVARGHSPEELIPRIFASCERSLVRPKAKARGLTLRRVFYEE